MYLMILFQILCYLLRDNRSWPFLMQPATLHTRPVRISENALAICLLAYTLVELIVLPRL